MGTVKYSGPVASFHCPTNAEIRSLKVHFSPKQEGSGDPSPENVRPIKGWDGVEMYDWTSANASTSSVPSEYKKIEYLESTGTQYIYTNVPSRYGIECRAKVSWTSGGDTTIFGARKATSDRIMLIHQYPSNRWTLGYGASYTGLSQIDFNTIYDVESKVCPGEQYLKINGTIVYTGTDSTEYSNNFNMSLFACTNGSNGNINLKSSARIYSLSAKLDGVETLNVVPCLRKSDNKPGMYDTVSQTFYTNAGTGEFLYGPEISGYTEDYEFGVLGKNKLNADAEQQVPSDTASGPATKRTFTPNTYCVGMSWSNYYISSQVTAYSVSNGTITITNNNVYGLGYPVQVATGQTYYLSAITTNGRAHIAYFAADGTYVSGVSTNILNSSFTVPNDVKTAVIIFYSNGGEATFSNIQLELGSTATTYEPYDPNKTVYGGWVDLISGEVQQEWTEPLTLGEPYYYGGNVCFKYIYPSKYTAYSSSMPVDRVFSTFMKSDFSINPNNNFIFGGNSAFVKTDGNGNLNPEWTEWYDSLETKPTISLKLYEPITYHLAPTSMQTFLAQNNIWSNADYVEVEYDLHETQTILARKQFIIASQPHVVKPAAAPLQNFVTDMAAPLKECKVYFGPVQEGTGDPSPENVRPISGWTGVEVTRCGKNMLPAVADSITKSGVTYAIEKDSNGSITRIHVTGTSTSNSSINTIANDLILPPGNYTLTAMTDGDGQHDFNLRKRGTSTDIVQRVSPKTFSISETTAYQSAYVYCKNGNTFDFYVHPMIRLSSIIDDTFEPYSGTTLPITFPSEAGTIYGGYVDLVNGELVQEWHTISIDETAPMRVFTPDARSQGTYCNASYWLSTFNAPNGAGYEPYSYDGFCNKLVYYENNYAQNSRAAAYNSTADICLEGVRSQEDYLTWLAENGPITICYRLKNPIHYSLTPTQLKTLRGTNNIWASNGGDNIEIAYWTH